MLVSTAEYDPTDLLGRDERDAESRRQAIAAEIGKREDLASLLHEPWGRRLVRKHLREGGFNLSSDVVPTVLNPDHGRMCFDEGYRQRGLALLWPIVRAVAAGTIPLESLHRLMTESDE